MKAWFMGPVAAGVLVLLTVGGGSASSPPAPKASAARSSSLRAGNDAFAGRLLPTAAPAQPNLVMSPFSISQALAMLYPAARGATARQIAAAADFGTSSPALARGFGALAGSLATVDRPGATIDTANAMYGQAGYAFRTPFLNLLARALGAPLRSVDFAAAPSAAVQTINGWVASRTRRKVTRLLDSSDVDASTRLVLVTAIYLQAKWLSPFTHGMTSLARFAGAGGAESVPTMHQDAGFPYRRAPGYQVAELPYVGGRLAFDVLLPDRGRLPALLARISAGGPGRLVSHLRPAELSLALPKLSIRSRVELAPALRGLGMRLAFEPGAADLSGAGGRPGELNVQAVVHEAYLRVDEAGTEAAAATGVSISPTAALLTTPFDVDRPFIFLLRDRRTGTVLFDGIVQRP